MLVIAIRADDEILTAKRKSLAPASRNGHEFEAPVSSQAVPASVNGKPTADSRHESSP